MKNFLILLFIPLIGVSQISYKDVMKIKDVNQFKRVMIENGLEFESSDDDLVTYGLDIVKDPINGNKSTLWGYYQKGTQFWGLDFSRSSLLSELLPHLNELVLEEEGSKLRSEYDKILKEVKEKCKYYEIFTFSGNDYVTYSCSESLYGGKIGFMVSEGWGYIKHFPKTD